MIAEFKKRLRQLEDEKAYVDFSGSLFQLWITKVGKEFDELRFRPFG